MPKSKIFVSPLNSTIMENVNASTENVQSTEKVQNTENVQNTEKLQETASNENVQETESTEKLQETEKTENVQETEKTEKTEKIQSSWHVFCEKAKLSIFVVPLRLRPDEVITFTDYKEKETKTGKTLLLLVTENGKEVPLFVLPEIAKAIQDGKIPNPKEKPLSVKITEVVKNEKGYKIQETRDRRQKTRKK